MGDRLPLSPFPISSIQDTRNNHDLEASRAKAFGDDKMVMYHHQQNIHPQDFELPRVVKTKLSADVEQSKAFALTSALFAGALVTLIQTVSPIRNTAGAGWLSLGFFVYTAVTINLTGTTLALVLIKLCTDVEGTAQQMIILDSESWPARVARGEKIERHLILDHHKLLREFGMTKGYKVLSYGAGLWISSANIFTFISVTLWVWLALPPEVAGPTMIGTVPVMLGLMYAIALTKRS